jgi:hypothetical protein
MTCDHDPDDVCDVCRPSPVPDGRALLDAFKAKHGIKSDDLARSLMEIESFRPLPKDRR